MSPAFSTYSEYLTALRDHPDLVAEARIFAGSPPESELSPTEVLHFALRRGWHPSRTIRPT